MQDRKPKITPCEMNVNKQNKDPLDPCKHKTYRQIGLISWKTRKQPTVALSTWEAEYMSLISAIQEAKYLAFLIFEITGIKLTCHLNCDNQGTIALAKNPIKLQRTKRVDIKYHFIRDEIVNGAVCMLNIPSDSNLAYIFTKQMISYKSKIFKNSIFWDLMQANMIKGK